MLNKIFNKEKPNAESKLTIKRGKASNYYSILLHTNKALEEYRTRSGMKKNFTTEYQHHYWFLNFRMKYESEIFDLNVPLVMYNYEQSVSGTSVHFNLETVEKVSDSLLELATEKAEELMEVFGNDLLSILPFEAKLVPLGTLHTHPGSMSVFSGTDYKSDSNNPGICHPLEEVEPNTASLSSIVCHNDGIAKLVRTESCLVNRKDNVITYSEGKTLSFVRDYKGEDVKPIQSMFEEPQFLEEYFISNGIRNRDDDNNELINKIFDLWNASSFDINTENIKKDNIKGFESKRMYGPSKYKLIDNEEEPIFILGNLYYKEKTYTEDDIDDMRKELESLNVFDKRRLALMNSKKVVKIFIDEGF